MSQEEFEHIDFSLFLKLEIKKKIKVEIDNVLLKILPLFRSPPLVSPKNNWFGNDPFKVLVLSGQPCIDHCLDWALNGPMYQGR